MQGAAASPSPPAKGGEGRGEEGRANTNETPLPSPLPVRRGEGEGTVLCLSFLNSMAVLPGSLPTPSSWREGIPCASGGAGKMPPTEPDEYCSNGGSQIL